MRDHCLCLHTKCTHSKWYVHLNLIIAKCHLPRKYFIMFENSLQTYICSTGAMTAIFHLLCYNRKFIIYEFAMSRFECIIYCSLNFGTLMSKRVLFHLHPIFFQYLEAACDSGLWLSDNCLFVFSFFAKVFQQALMHNSSLLSRSAGKSKLGETWHQHVSKVGGGRLN